MASRTVNTDISFEGSGTVTNLRAPAVSTDAVRLADIPGLMLSGSGAPGAGVGRNGDWYLDTGATPAVLYGPKTAGTWPGTTQRVLGSASIATTAPTGPQTGQFWFKSDTSDLLFWDGTTWVQINASTSSFGTTILSGAGAPAGGTGSDGNYYVNLTTGDLYGPKTAGAWPVTFNAGTGGSHPFTAAATAPATPAAGDHWYDTDPTSRRLATYTADGWVSTSRKHRYDYSLADFQDQADPVQAALTKMAADHGAIAVGALDPWWGTPSAAIDFVLHVPPGNWGTATTAYTIDFPLSIQGPTISSTLGATQGCLLSGDFTFLGVSNNDNHYSISDIAIEGLHTIGSGTTNPSVRFTRCFFLDDISFTGRPGSILTVNRVKDLVVDDCYFEHADSTATSYPVHFTSSAVTVDQAIFRNCAFNTGASGASSIRFDGRHSNAVIVERCSFQGALRAVDISGEMGFGVTAMTVIDRCFAGECLLSFRPTGTMTSPNTRVSVSDSVAASGAAALPGIEVDLSGTTIANAGIGFMRVSGCEFPGVERGIYINTKGSGTLGSSGDVWTTVIDGNNFTATAASGKAIEITGPVLSASTSVTVSGNTVKSSVAGQAPIGINNMGSVHVRGNTVTTAAATDKAVDVTNCGVAVVTENILRAGTVDTTGTAQSLVANNI